MTVILLGIFSKVLSQSVKQKSVYERINCHCVRHPKMALLLVGKVFCGQNRSMKFKFFIEATVGE